MLKVLNLYACLGGNRYKWTDCEVTAVELDPELARMYQERFPNDKVIIADAHLYLLDHYKEFDFIWSSPPCPTHSKARYWSCKNGNNLKVKPVYPEMSLYQEIIFLQHYFKGKYVVENVNPYYEPLIPAKKIGRHLFWVNFKIPDFKIKDVTGKMNNQGRYKQLIKYHDLKIFDYNGNQSKLKILRNLVDYEVGNAIFEIAKGNFKINNDIKLFEE